MTEVGLALMWCLGALVGAGVVLLLASLEEDKWKRGDR